MNIDIDKIKRRLLIKYPLFGSILANTNFIEDKNCYSNGVPTAGTDGDNVYYHPDALKSITDDQQVFLFAHEICHIAFDHIPRSEGKDLEIWNIATDAVDNAHLSNDGLPLTPGSVNMPEAINYTAEEFYEKLLKQKMDNQNQSDNEQSQNTDAQIGQSTNGSQKSNSNEMHEHFNQQSNKAVGHDTHSMWKKAVDKKKRAMSDNQNQNDIKQPGNDLSKGKSNNNQFQDNENEEKNNDNKTNNKLSQTSYKGNDEKKDSDDLEKQKSKEQKKQQVKRLTDCGEKEAFKQNRIKRKQQLEKLREILSKQSIGAGDETNEQIIKVDNIGISDELIDWRRLLRETITYDVDWSYRNASIEDGVLTPYLEDIPKPETEIVLDTSGSTIDENLLRNFLRECKSILKSSKIKVGCFDTKFYGFTEIRNINDIDNMEFVGGGGTDFNAAVNAFSQRVENKIIFTDGYADMPNKSLDAIWIVFGNVTIKPKGGKVIQISLESLYNINQKRR